MSNKLFLFPKNYVFNIVTALFLAMLQLTIKTRMNSRGHSLVATYCFFPCRLNFADVAHVIKQLWLLSQQHTFLSNVCRLRHNCFVIMVTGFINFILNIGNVTKLTDYMILQVVGSIKLTNNYVGFYDTKHFKLIRHRFKLIIMTQSATT